MALTSHVGDEKGGAIPVHREHVEIIAADGRAGNADAACVQMREVFETTGKQGALDLACDFDFLLEAPSLPISLNKMRILQDARCFHAERIQDSPVEIRVCRRAAGVQIDSS